MKGVGLGVFLPERGAGSQCGFAGEGVVEEISLGYSACRLAKGGPVNRPGLSRHLMTAIGRFLPVARGRKRPISGIRDRKQLAGRCIPTPSAFRPALLKTSGSSHP